MININNLLNRKTVKNFIPKKIPDDILDNALKIAWKAPTAYNARPTTVYDITKYRNSEWIAGQQSTKTADRIFLFCYNPKEADMNIRKFISKRMWSDDLFSDKINSIINNGIWVDPINFCKQQTYITAWYFASVLEVEWISWCFIVWLDKDKCKSDLKFWNDTYPELIFACWFKDDENPWSSDTDFVRSFESFYFWEV